MRKTPGARNGAVGVISVILLAAIQAANLLAASAANPSQVAPSTTNQTVGVQPQTAFVRVTPRVAEIVRMVKARLDPGVIKAYISSSISPFSPTAADIVVLKRIGIPEELITLMLQHDAELLRVRQNSATPASVRAAPVSPHPPAFSPDYAPMYPPAPNYAYPYLAYRRPPPILFGPLTSFNNSFPTFINGQGVYSGYYLPAYGF